MTARPTSDAVGFVNAWDASEARTIGRVPPRMGPHELMCHLLARRAMCAPVEIVAPGITRGMLIDAQEILLALYRNNAETLDLQGSASAETKAIVNQQAHLCAVISILNKRAGEDAVDNGSERIADAQARALGARQPGARS